MVKLFFIGIGVFVVVVGAGSARLGLLLAGVARDLGVSPRLPFQSPIPQPAVDAVHGWLAQITPTMWLALVLGVMALLLLTTLGTLVAQLVRRRAAARTGGDAARARSRAESQAW